MVTLPGATPVTVPEVPIEAIEPLLLLHTPPKTRSVRLVVAPWHIAIDKGDMAEGAFTTVTVFVATQVPIE
jgi:hypothetical protein